MRIGLLQINPVVGDLDGNRARILRAYRAACAQGADLVIAPELAVTGYPPRDLLNRVRFVRDALASLASLADDITDPPLLAGALVGIAPDPLLATARFANAAVLLADRKVRACHRKMLLPTYDVFDEARYFTPGDAPTCIEVAGVRLGITVCEDIWNDKQYWGDARYTRDPVIETVAAGAKLLVNISASPYAIDKPGERAGILAGIAKRHRVPVLYVNQVGGNDALLFDGRSLGYQADGALALRLPAFSEAVRVVEFQAGVLQGDVTPEPAGWEDDAIAALTMGLRDYATKCGFERVVLGLSGGIDSALACTLSVRALGRERVIGVAMPSRFSSAGSRADAHDLATRLGIRIDTVNIEPMFQAYLQALAPPFAGLPWDVTEENLQARVRGALLMAYANKLPRTLLLTTGNKSELAVGYCTLYGDMCGGLAVISDLYKMQVYALAQHLNATMQPQPIPISSLSKAPSAELRANQTDQDSLPPYEILDVILKHLVDDEAAAADVIAAGHDSATVQRVARMLDRAEYKRRQMPPGLRVSRKAFGEGRRLPIAQAYDAGASP